MESKTKKAIGFSIGGAILLAGAIWSYTYFILPDDKGKTKYQKKKEAKSGGGDSGGTGNDTQSTNNSSVNSPQPSTTVAKIPSDDFPLKVGSMGKYVVMLQVALKAKGATVTVDGKYGAETKQALNSYAGYWCGWGGTCDVNKSDLALIVLSADKSKLSTLTKQYGEVYNSFK